MVRMGQFSSETEAAQTILEMEDLSRSALSRASDPVLRFGQMLLQRKFVGIASSFPNQWANDVSKASKMLYDSDLQIGAGAPSELNIRGPLVRLQAQGLIASMSSGLSDMSPSQIPFALLPVSLGFMDYLLLKCAP